MADLDHTLESSSAQENSPLIIDLIVQEIFVAAPTGIGSLAMSVIPREYEPSILLQGEWVRKMGFKIGQPIRVIAKRNVLQVEQVKVPALTSYRLWGDEDEILSFDDLKDEKYAIKTENDDKKQGVRRGRNGDTQGSENGRRNGSENGSESDDKGEVLAEVNCEFDND